MLDFDKYQQFTPDPNDPSAVFLVSEEGEVLAVREVAQRSHKSGRAVVSALGTTMTVASLVARCFLEQPEGKKRPRVYFKDGDPGNVHPSNLTYSKAEAMASPAAVEKAKAAGADDRSARARAEAANKRPDITHDELLELIEDGVPTDDIAEAFGTSVVVIDRMLTELAEA